MRWRAGVVTVAALWGATWGAFAAAASDAPAGWTAAHDGALRRYTTGSGDAAVEMRLHPAQAGRGDALQRFRERLVTPPAGVGELRYEPPRASPGGGFAAVGRGRVGARPVLVAAVGCEAASGALVYGELLAPMDGNALQRRLPAALDLLARECRPQAAQAPAAAAMPKAAAAPAHETPSTAAAALTPGQGLRAERIEAVLYSWRQVYRVTGLQFEDETYLLLADGSYRKGLPAVAFDQWDAAASRQGEKKLWGQWRRSGAKYELSRADTPGQWFMPPGQDKRVPGRANERLDGTWSTSSSSSIGSTAAWSTRRVRLTREGRFEQSKSGGVGGSAVPGSPDSVHGRTVYDDRGSAGVTAAPNFGGGGSRTRPDNTADRAGSYRIDGWTIELRYDNGRVARVPFHANADRTFVHFNGMNLMRDKK